MKILDLVKVLFIVIVSIIIASIVKDKFFTDNSEFEKLRREIVKSSTLIKQSEGRYSKLLDDYNSEKELFAELKKTNESLYKDIKKTNDKLVAVTQTLLKFKDTSSVIQLEEPIEDLIKKGDTLDFYYPTRQDYLVKHSLLFSTETAESIWTFTPTNIDLVITETEDGIFKTNIGTNPWMEVSSLRVNTLPLEVEKKDLFGWAYGVGAFKNPETFGIDIYGGIRLSNFNILIRFQPAINSQIGAALIYNPK